MYQKAMFFVMRLKAKAAGQSFVNTSYMDIEAKRKEQDIGSSQNE